MSLVFDFRKDSVGDFNRKGTLGVTSYLRLTIVRSHSHLNSCIVLLMNVRVCHTWIELGSLILVSSLI